MLILYYVYRVYTEREKGWGRNCFHVFVMRNNKHCRFDDG